MKPASVNVSGPVAESPPSVSFGDILRREVWPNIDKSGLVALSIITLVASFHVQHFLGTTFALVFVPSAILINAVTLAIGAWTFFKPERPSIYAVTSSFVSYACWAAMAVSLYLTDSPAASVIALATAVTSTFYALFSPYRTTIHRWTALAPPVLALLFIMLHAIWAGLPTDIAIPASVSAFGTLAVIAQAAWSGAQDDLKLTRAMVSSLEDKKKLQFVISSTGDGYFEIGLNPLTFRPDQTFAQLLGVEEKETPLWTLSERAHPDDLAQGSENIRKLRAGLVDAADHEVRLRDRNGDYRWVLMRSRVLQSSPTGERLIIGIIVDMSKWKALEAEMRTARDVAESSSRAKGQFLANISHEIRTPLNGVLGMAQALVSDDLKPDQREQVAVILDSGKTLMALLNDVLDISKIEAGKLQVDPTSGDLLHTLKRMRQLFQPQADEKGIQLSVRCASDMPVRLVYDPVRVRQCIGNLLSNAIKFTQTGRVDVTVSAGPAGADGVRVRVVVTDSGIGMSTEVQERLFQAFTQADGATTRRFGGTGLGLAISRQLARLMGGDITVTSREGVGSEFVLTFLARVASMPTKSEFPEGVRPAEMRGLRGARVLLTDDNAVNRQVMKLFLAPQGCDIAEATNGKEALDLLAQRPFDIVLLDVHMPVMDGTEAIRRIRASSRSWSDLPVIALTADALSGDREKYLAMGMSDYVSKPVDQRELLTRMVRALNGGFDTVGEAEAANG